MTNRFSDGEQLKTDKDFANHQNLDIPVSVEEIEYDGVLTVGLIEKFDVKMVVIDGYARNRHTHLYISRPFHAASE
jgi:hypothetical protein